MKKEDECTTCGYCNQQMNPGKGCRTGFIYNGNNIFERILAGDMRDLWPGMGTHDICHHCNAGLGQYHHLGCIMERCPMCKGQLKFCGCFEDEYKHILMK